MRPWFAVLAAAVIIIAAVVLFGRIRGGQAEPSGVAAGDPAATVAAPVATADDAVATVGTAERLETYVSPRYGYAITYDEAIWDTFTLENTLTINGYLREMDVIEFRHQTNPVTVRISGERGWIGGSNWMPNCVEDELLAFTSFEGRDPLASPVPGGGDGRAWAEVDYQDGPDRATVYAECRWIGGDVTLTIRHTAPAADYQQSSAARDDVLAGLDTTGVAGDTATPAATPAASPVTGATPVASPAIASPSTP